MRFNQYQRLINACCFIAGMAILAFCLTSLQNPPEKISLASNIEEDNRVHQILYGSYTPSSASSAHQPSNVFVSEIMDASSQRNVVCSDQSSVVGFSFDGNPDDALAYVHRELIAHGWTLTSKNENHISSYIKDSGTYTWLLVSCVQIDSQTSVVIQTNY